MTTMFKRGLITVCMLSAFGCATAKPPQELVDARSAYARASSGPTPQLNPAELHVAKKALDQAEAAFDEDPSGTFTRALAYAAIRKAQLAEVDGRTMDVQGEKAASDERVRLTQAQLTVKAQGDLVQTKAQLTAAQQKLEDEKRARAEAEKQASLAMAEVARIAQIKDEPRGTVITIPGNVLFASAQSTFVPSAQAKLDLVAEALRKSSRRITVEGHADSQGNESSNMILSTRRAEATRDYLISRGVPEGQIEAKGFGSSRPIADNKTPEGRADNRRVEIILGPEKEDR